VKFLNLEYHTYCHKFATKNIVINLEDISYIDFEPFNGGYGLGDQESVGVTMKNNGKHFPLTARSGHLLVGRLDLK
jgi:hypothetical protein